MSTVDASVWVSGFDRPEAAVLIPLTPAHPGQFPQGPEDVPLGLFGSCEPLALKHRIVQIKLDELRGIAHGVRCAARAPKSVGRGGLR